MSVYLKVISEPVSVLHYRVTILTADLYVHMCMYMFSVAYSIHVHVAIRISVNCYMMNQCT